MNNKNDQTPMSHDDAIDQLSLDIAVLKEDINDFIEEISFESSKPEDIITKLESLLTLFRTKHYKLKHYSSQMYVELYFSEYESITAEIKSTIRDAKDVQSKLNAREKVVVINPERNEISSGIN